MLTGISSLPGSLPKALPHLAVPLSAMTLLCIQAQLPSSAEAGFGRISITGLQRLLWISCFLKLGRLLCQLTWLGRGPSRTHAGLCLLSCWQPNVLRFLYALDPKNSPVILPNLLVLSASTDYTCWIKVCCSVVGEAWEAWFYSLRNWLGTNSQKQ